LASTKKMSRDAGGGCGIDKKRKKTQKKTTWEKMPGGKRGGFDGGGLIMAALFTPKWG